MSEMTVPGWAARCLGTDGHERIEAAIAEAESRTSGEIVPLLVRRSSTIGHVPVLAFCLLLTAFLLAELPAVLGDWLGGHALIWMAATWILAAGGAVLFGRFDFVQRMLISQFDEVMQVERRAQLEFYELDLSRHKGAPASC